MKRLIFEIKLLLKNKDNRNLFNNILSAFIIKGISLCISVFSMPLYIKYFDNNEALGLWYTLLSIISWVLICDLGLGNGLRNKLTEAIVLKDTVRCRKLISSTYAILSTAILPVLLFGVVVIPQLDLNKFFNVSSQTVSPDSLKYSFVILFLGICCSFVLKVINSIIYAVQKSSLNNLLTLITSVIPLIYIAIFKSNSIDINLVALSYVHIFAVNFPLLLATVIAFFGTSLKTCRPSFEFIDKGIARQIFSIGVGFFVTQILFMLLTNTNEIIISRVYSSEFVVEYNIYFKLFTIIGSLYMLALTPMWSKVTKDLMEKKYGTLIKTNRVLLLISFVASLSEFALIPFLQMVINIWLGDKAITVNYITALIFAFYGSTYILNVVLTTIANGIGKLKTQMIFYGIGVVLKIPVILLLANLTGNWVTVMLYNAIVLMVFCVFQYLWINRSLLKLQRESLSTKDKI